MPEQLAVWFVNRFYHPDPSATSQMLTELTARISGDFHPSVVTSRQLSRDASARLERSEVVGGVRVVRLWTTGLGRASLWRRSFDYVSFYCSVLLFLFRHVNRHDIVVLKTDPPLMNLINTSLIRWKGGKVINWLQDIYPEIASRLGAFPGPGWLATRMASWRDGALRKAEANVVVSQAMERYLNARRVTNTEVISNWANEFSIRPLKHDENPLRTEWNLNGKFIVMYSGNFGRAHTFSEIATAVRQLAQDAEVHFMFIGDGAGLASFRRVLEQPGVGNFTFKPLQPKTNLSYSLGAADLHLVSLREGMEELLMPSKVFGILAAGRPIGFIGNPRGGLGAMVVRENVGFAVANGDSNALADAITRLKRDPVLMQEQQKRARLLFESSFTLGYGAQQWRRLLRRLQPATDE